MFKAAEVAFSILDDEVLVLVLDLVFYLKDELRVGLGVCGLMQSSGSFIRLRIIT